MSLRRFFQRAKWDRERQRELDSYLQIEIEDNAARGMTRNEAVAAAHRKLGNYTRIREEIYHMNTVSVLDSALARRSLCAARLAPQSHVHSGRAAHARHWHRREYGGVQRGQQRAAEAARLSEIGAARRSLARGARRSRHGERLRRSLAFVLDVLYLLRSEPELPIVRRLGPGNGAVTGLAEPEQVRTDSGFRRRAAGACGSAGHWPLAGARRSDSGRAITAVLGFGYWQRRFGGDRSVIGRTISVDANSVEIVGVMPRGFRVLDYDPELILPLLLDRGRATLPGFDFQGIARLKPGITISQANADITRLLPIWQRSWPMTRAAKSLRPISIWARGG